ncbi:hypothetical protein NLG97_g8912 [Lecanicillium saksenae]|uniref:Uncharacterized protein n=1 Tax=Lecanicillium saksenae TaxID=468837 RepID=A0ACC1QHQ4_9HYPO|nr:hypothetical protein NLG97_g8912 [Lecanicillium saksenae]
MAANLTAVLHIVPLAPAPATLSHHPEPRANTQKLTLHAAPDPSKLLIAARWLNEFQILAFIPLSGAVSFEEIADLAHVSERHLTRVVRMTATAGFLHEPQRGTVAHTPLSAPFVKNLNLVDAVVFLGRCAAPGALAMPSVTCASDQEGSRITNSTNLAAALSSQSESAEVSKLQRQWEAYRSCVEKDEDNFTNLLGRLKWSCLGGTRVVDACAKSTKVAGALARMHPSLSFIVQMRQPAREHTEGTCETGCSERIMVQERMPMAVQSVKDAAVYIVRLEAAASAQILHELRAHLGILQGNPAATLILALPLLPEPGTVTPAAEARARLHDLCRLQLLREELALDVDDLPSLVQTVRDIYGSLVVASTLRCSQSAAVAFGIKYRRFTEQNAIDD